MCFWPARQAGRSIGDRHRPQHVEAYHGKKEANPLHIDYCFMPEACVERMAHLEGLMEGLGRGVPGDGGLRRGEGGRGVRLPRQGGRQAACSASRCRSSGWEPSAFETRA